MIDSFRTIRGQASAEIKVKGSRFIAEAYPCITAAEAEAHIASVRKREYAATHHCMAYRLGAGGTTVRYDDDGEPSGTAGAPMLRQIEARDLTDTLVIVTRYFGGTKLGTGGLIRAYGDAASAVLDLCDVEERILRDRMIVRFEYPDTSPALHTLHRFDTLIEEQRYGDRTDLVIAVRRSQAGALRDAFVDALAGRGQVIEAGD